MDDFLIIIYFHDCREKPGDEKNEKRMNKHQQEAGVAVNQMKAKGFNKNQDKRENNGVKKNQETQKESEQNPIFRDCDVKS